METVLAYWLGQGYLFSPLAGLVLLVATVAVALNLECPEKKEEEGS